jgi:CheY-like chemotaxis protein
VAVTRVERKRAGDTRPATVLVVEDDRWIRSLLTDLLPAEGYVVEEATNGAAGVRLARAHRPDVVLLDLAMPEMSGAEVLRELKSDSTTADIPIIVVSAYAGNLQGTEARTADSVIQKPFDLGDLLARIERATSSGD